MRLITIEMKIMLETDNLVHPLHSTLVDSIALATQDVIRKSAGEEPLDFGIIIRETKKEQVVTATSYEVSKGESMKVRDLIALLSTVDLDREVILQMDLEGASFAPLLGGCYGAYLASGPSSGITGLEKLTQKEIDEGFTTEDVLATGVPALILFSN